MAAQYHAASSVADAVRTIYHERRWSHMDSPSTPVTVEIAVTVTRVAQPQYISGVSLSRLAAFSRENMAVIVVNAESAWLGLLNANDSGLYHRQVLNAIVSCVFNSLRG